MTQSSLVRAVGLPGAVMMGLGSIVGTGVFVSLGLTAGLTGTSMIFALFIAGLLAICNGFSTAQLAAAHPVSGGTYEYGYLYISPLVGFLAGWLFVCAKSASAATAAIGFGGYLLQTIKIKEIEPWHIGLAAVILIVMLALRGIRRSSASNIAIVSITLFALILYVLMIGPEVNIDNMTPIWGSATGEHSSASGFLESIALLFVAYTGYGRIATLGEEIKNPQKNIPRAVIYTLGLSFLLYMTVALVSVGAVGPKAYYDATIIDKAPLEVIANATGHPLTAKILAVGAMTAMLGVLLNLILGLSRVILAMGRKQDLPNVFAKIDPQHHAPYVGIIASGVVIGTLVLLKDVKATWSFSAFTVLVYYAITNASALRLPPEKRLYPRIFSVIGLIGCLGISIWVDFKAMLAGLAILFAGILWRTFFHKLKSL
jgi:APA family basic amino acid/polyamine antiporter